MFVCLSCHSIKGMKSFHFKCLLRNLNEMVGNAAVISKDRNDGSTIIFSVKGGGNCESNKKCINVGSMCRGAEI